MRRTAIICGFILLACALFASSACAGEALDRILNNVVLGTDTGGENRDRAKTVVNQVPLGQTFTTRADAAEVSRIELLVADWHEDWTPDESLVLTLWDSPAKKKKIASDEMPAELRHWSHNYMIFTLNAPVEPSTQYYFELTVKGGDGAIAGIFLGGDYEGGEPYEGGKKAIDNMWFRTHERPKFDRDKVYGDRFAQWDLDYPGLEKVKAAVQKKDWDKAVDELIAYYEGREDLLPAKDCQPPKIVPDFDPSFVDLILEKKYKDDGKIIHLGPRWNQLTSWPGKGGIGFSRTGLHKHFRAGYQCTGDEKYAKAYNEFLTCILNDLPSPMRSGLVSPDAEVVPCGPRWGLGGGRMWDALAIGSKLGLVWWKYSGFITSSNFTRDIRAGLIFDMADGIALLSKMQGSGNWQASISKATFEFGEKYPEFKDSDEWFKKGLSAALKNMEETMFEDGPSHECSINYHNIVINRYSSVLMKCKELGVDVDQKYWDMLEKAVEYDMYTTQPDWELPARGDTGLGHDGLGQMMKVHELFDRPDFLWVATKGKEGKMPEQTSKGYLISGWFNMRSSWTEDALYMNVHNGFNRGHGHPDALSLVVNAYGNKLIIDPGIGTYGTPEAYELTHTRSHATVCVDDKPTHQLDGKNIWASTSTMDYLNATNAGYADLDGIRHNRRIIFVKPLGELPGYWLLKDTVTGEGEHEVVSRFPFYPGPASLDKDTRIFRTENKGGNLMVVPLTDNDFAAEKYDHIVDLHGLTDGPVVKYSKKTELPVSFSTLLFPYKGQKSPNNEVVALGEDAYVVSTGAGADYVSYGDVSTDEFSFQGEAVVVRMSGGLLRSFAWVNGKSVVVEGRTTLETPIVFSDKPIEKLEMVMDGDTLIVTTSSEEPSLRINTMGASKIRVNGKKELEVNAPAIYLFK